MRTVTLLFALALPLVACDSDADLSVEEIYRAAEEAREAGDAQTFVRLVREAAEQDDIGALGTLAQIGRRGYVGVGSGAQPTYKAFRLWPGEGARWERRYHRAIEREAAAGSHKAQFQRAIERMGQGYLMRGPSTIDPAEMEEGEAEIMRLAAARYGPAMTFTALRLARTDTAAARIWFDRAADAGEEHACLMGASLLNGRGSGHARGMSRLIDRKMECINGAEEVRSTLSKLYREEAGGNAAATAHLDSLVALGVFERHPELSVGRRGAR